MLISDGHFEATKPWVSENCILLRDRQTAKMHLNDFSTACSPKKKGGGEKIQVPLRTVDDKENQFIVAFYRLLGKKTVPFLCFSFFPFQC